jgi:tyrosinase
MRRRSLTIPERKDYIRAVNCMFTKPPISKKYFSVVQSRYDDFVALHANATGGGIKLDGFKGMEEMVSNPFGMAGMMSSGIHGTGTFLPWHRLAIQVWEDALTQECGWKGAQPCMFWLNSIPCAFSADIGEDWDWQLDTPEAGSHWLKSPLFDVETGFGGNGAKMNISATPFGLNASAFASLLPKGVTLESLPSIIPGFEVMGEMMGTGGGCIQDGPFKGRRVTIGPMGRMVANNTRCLTRSFSPGGAHAAASKKSIMSVLKASTFAQFRMYMEQPKMTMSTTGGKFNMSNEGGGLHNIGHFGVGGEVRRGPNFLFAFLLLDYSTDLNRCWIYSTQRMIHYSGFTILDLTGFGLFGKKKIRPDCATWMGRCGCLT